MRPGFQTESAIGGPSFGPDGIRGVLAAESSPPSKFDGSAAHFMQAMANIVGTTLLTAGSTPS